MSADRIRRRALEALTGGRERRHADLVLRAGLFDAAGTRGAVLQQLFESLQALAGRRFLSLRACDGPLRFDALIAFRRDERRDRHQPLAPTDSDACPRARRTSQRASNRCGDDHATALGHDDFRSERAWLRLNRCAP